MKSSIDQPSIEVSKNQPDFQWDDFLKRKEDLYAATKYSILIDWIQSLQSTGSRLETALVIGCGSGELAVELKRIGLTVTASDIDEATVNLAKRLAGQDAENIEYLVSNLEDFSIAKKYDLVFATDVIEHIKDDLAAVNKILSLVSNERYAVITVPASPFVYGIHDEQLGHFRRYSKSTLSILVDSRNRILKLRYFGFLFVPISFLVSRVLRKQYPLQTDSDSRANVFLRSILKVIFSVEKILPGLTGTSLLMLVQKNK